VHVHVHFHKNQGSYTRSRNFADPNQSYMNQTTDKHLLSRNRQHTNHDYNRITTLQHTLGNQFVQRLIKSGIIQPKLQISHPSDPYEQEADRLVDEVMRMIVPDSVSKGKQRVRGKYAAREIGKKEEEMKISRKPSASLDASDEATSEINNVRSSSGTPLDYSTKEFMESRLGYDFSRVRVHADSLAAHSAKEVAADAYTVGQHIVFGAGQYAPHTLHGRRLIAHELVHTAQQGSADMLRRQPSRAANQPEFKRFVIKIPAGITTQQQFLRYVEVRIFGRVLNLTWISHSRAADEPAKHVGKPVPVSVRTSVLNALSRPEGAGDAKAEKAEAEKTYKGLGPEEKDAIKVEIDRRYYESTQEVPGTKIKGGETGKAIIWNSLKQEVLADRKKLEQLPETIKSLLGESNFTPENYKTLVQLGETLSQLSDAELKAFFATGPNGATITPTDYPQLLSIARKLAALPPEARQDYLSRVKASTTSLRELENSIDNYLQFRADREKQVQQHEAAAKPLLGAEDLYTAYRNYKKEFEKPQEARKNLNPEWMPPDYLLDRLQATLLTALKHKGFDSIAAFEKTIESYRVAFRTQAVNLALDVLARYDHMLFEESKKLQQPGAAAAIAQGIGSTKAAEYYKEYHTQKTIASNIWMAKEPKETWWQKPYNEAESAAAAAKGSAQKEVLRGSGGDPLIQERNIDLEKLASADAAGVQSYLTKQIDERVAHVKTTRSEFNEDADRVFSRPDLVAATYKMLGVDSSTVYGRIISDYIDDEASKHLFSSIALGILVAALAFLIPGGGWLAAAALVGQAGLSTYQAYQAYKEYQEQERGYELGFLSTEPSLLWVGLAVLGAVADIGGTMTAYKLIKQSATALKTLEGPMLKFAKEGERELPTLLAKIEAAEALDIKFKAALAREAKASLGAKEALKELTSMGGRIGAFAGADPGVAKVIFRYLYYSIKRGINNIVKLSADAKFLEIAGDLTKMSGAERAELEAAFEQVKNLYKTGTAKGMDESSLVNFVDRWALNRGKPGFQTKLLDEMNAWKPLTAEQKKALDALAAQRSAVTSLYDQKAAAQEELAALRAKVDKSKEDIAEIRELEKELRDLDPNALPGKRPREGIGKIAEAEMKLEQVEKEAAKAQLSLYDRMRGSNPSFAARERALLQPNVEDIAGPLKTKPTLKQVDHIVSVREISDMDGFADLPLKDQREIVNMQENLIGMDGSANASKGERTWKSWSEASRFYEKSTIDAMAKREADLRALIQAEVKNRLEKLAAKP
jgi:hypothetical protein